MLYVPPEIIANIFWRLPVKSLLRFKCVTKSFRTIIDSPDFIKLHLNHSLKYNSKTISSNHLIYSNFDFKVNYYHVEVFGSCNGLLCLVATVAFSDLADIYIANPSTRNYIKLPFNQIKYSHLTGWTCSPSSGSVVYGFGYDYVNDDYKVFRISRFVGRALVEYDVSVYSLKSNTWRKIKDFPHMFYYMRMGVQVNGALHWIAREKPDPQDDLKIPSRGIFSLDIATEEYRWIPLPQHTCEGRYGPRTAGWDVLMEFGGRLCVQCRDKEKYIDIWVMKYYGEVDSWTKLCSVVQPSSRVLLNQYIKAIAYSDDGDKLLVEQQGGVLVLYDLKREMGENLMINFFQPYIYTESLVKLTSDANNIRKLNSGARNNRKAKKRIQRRDDILLKGFNLKLSRLM